MAYAKKDLENITASINDLKKFIPTQATRSYIGLAAYKPDAPGKRGKQHAFVVVYSTARREHLLYRLSDHHIEDFISFTQNIGDLLKEFKMFRTLRIIYWKEFYVRLTAAKLLANSLNQEDVSDLGQLPERFFNIKAYKGSRGR